MPTRSVASSSSSHFSYETLADQYLINPQLATMAKKRKLEPKAEAATSSETVSFTEESVEEEPATDPTNEATVEGSPAPEGVVLIKEESLVEEESQIKLLESSDLVPYNSVAGDAPLADVVVGGYDEEEDSDDPESLQELLEPLSKEQLVSLLQDAALKHSDLWASIRQTADADPAYRKVFVHGLGWNTTTETLSSFFRQYGEIEDCKAVVDKITGKSKGYGFILFKHRSGARRALKEPQKKMGNRLASCQLASIGPVPAPPPVLPASEYTQRKIYVSNVGAELDPQKILQFFLKYGEIEDGPLGLDKATGKPKGFCLFVYKSAESARKALEEPHKNFEGHILHCQKAIDGPKPNKQGVYLPPVSGQYAVGQYAGLHQGPTGFGARVPQYVRNDGAVPMGAMSSSIGGPGHLIAPPAASMGYNQTGVAVNNGALAMKSAYGNQVVGAGGYVKTGVMGGYGSSAQMHGSYGGAPMTQGTARTQQGHIGGVGSYMGH